MIFCGNQTRSGLLGEIFGKLPREDPFSPTNPGVQDSIASGAISLYKRFGFLENLLDSDDIHITKP